MSIAQLPNSVFEENVVAGPQGSFDPPSRCAVIAAMHLRPLEKFIVPGHCEEILDGHEMVLQPISLADTR